MKVYAGEDAVTLLLRAQCRRYEAFGEHRSR